MGISKNNYLREMNLLSAKITLRFRYKKEQKKSLAFAREKLMKNR
jgi:hypothetical protein